MNIFTLSLLLSSAMDKSVALTSSNAVLSFPDVYPEPDQKYHPIC